MFKVGAYCHHDILYYHSSMEFSYQCWFRDYRLNLYHSLLSFPSKHLTNSWLESLEMKMAYRFTNYYCWGYWHHWWNWRQVSLASIDFVMLLLNSCFDTENWSWLLWDNFRHLFTTPKCYWSYLKAYQSKQKFSQWWILVGPADWNLSLS